MTSYSRENVKIVKCTDAGRQTVGGEAIKMKIETTIRMQDIHASMRNEITGKREATGLLAVGQRC